MAVTTTLIGVCIFIFAWQVSFQMEQFEFDLKTNLSDQHEYVNVHPPPPMCLLSSYGPDMTPVV